MPSLQKSKVLAFLEPVISVASGALAAWLLVHVHFLAVFHVGTSEVAKDIASGVVFLVASALVWLSTHQHLVPIVNALKAGATPLKGTFTLAEIIAFLVPYISIIAGAVSTWLFVHVHFLGIFHVAQTGVAAAVASAIVFGATAVITWLSHTLHWLPIQFPAAARGKR